MSDLIDRRAVLSLLIRCNVSENVGGLLYQSIKQLPPAQQETCEYWDDESNYCTLYRPSAQSERKRGKWMHDGSNWKNRWVCSECGRKIFDEPTNYCEMCGSRNEVVG